MVVAELSWGDNNLSLGDATHIYINLYGPDCNNVDAKVKQFYSKLKYIEDLEFNLIEEKKDEGI